MPELAPAAVDGGDELPQQAPAAMEGSDDLSAAMDRRGTKRARGRGDELKHVYPPPPSTAAKISRSGG